ncbi:MAG TPA: DNA primase [Gammaproteobacteria bacterium]|nr:DNA primase [Gammaproteobacteria bacterium]
MAGRIPQHFINDLIDRADIVSVIDERVTLKKTGKNYSGLCPFHDEKTPSFSVSPDKQFFHCFGCQESGTVLTFLMKYERLEFVEAVEMLARDMGMEVPREQGRGPVVKVDEDLYTVLEQAERFYRNQLRGASAAVDYLKGRGLTGEIARDFGIGYAPAEWHGVGEALTNERVSEEKLLTAGLLTKNDKGRVYDRFRDRIMFPIRDTRGRVIAFGGRILSQDGGPKYLNSPETPIFFKAQELYGLYEARKALRNIEELLVVEGYMDVVALAQNGIVNAVATLGTATGEAHFKKLYRYADRVVCCFDGDKAGRSAAWRALESALPVLNEHRQLKFAFLPDGEDPDSLIRTQGQPAFQGFIDNAVPALEFLLSRLADGLDLATLDGRAKFIGLASPYVEKITPGVLRDLVQARVRDLGGMAQPLPRSKPAFRRPNPQQAQRTQELSQRMAEILLRLPSLWQQLSDQQRQDLQLHAGELGVFGALVQLVQQHPEADSEEILVRWQGLPGYDDIQQLAQRKSLLDSAGQQKAFFEGIEKMLKRRKGRPQVAEIRARVAASSSQVTPELPDSDSEFDPFDELATDPDDYSDQEFPI